MSGFRSLSIGAAALIVVIALALCCVSSVEARRRHPKNQKPITEAARWERHREKLRQAGHPSQSKPDEQEMDKA
jgi:hypothetical protein